MGDPSREIATARLLLEAARYLGETLDPDRVYERFREILTEAIPHDGVVVSSFDRASRAITCDYAWVDGTLMDVSIFPPLELNDEGGMQSEVIRTGRPLLTNDVAARVQDSGTYYDIDGSGTVRKVPDEGMPKVQAAMMLPVKHEGEVVGVVQLMSDHVAYGAQQLQLAEGIVAQLGAAVRNARLHEEALRLEAAAAAAQAAALERERAAQVLEAVGDGIFSVDRGGVVRFWNRAAERLTRLPAEDVVGRPIAEVGRGWGELGGAVPPAHGDELPRSVTLPLDVAARELWLSFVAVSTSDGIVYAFRDMTAERQLDDEKHEFIATVSHELRTPMTAVLGAAHTLLRTDIDLPPEMKSELLQMIASQAARLARITDSVLLAGRLDRGDVVLETRRVDVDEVVRGTVEALAPTVPPTITIEQQLEANASSFSDANRLQQVLMNLLDNAVKYSPDGGTIRVHTEHVGGVVQIEVADEGAGISPADCDRIFERFYRGDASKKLVLGGTGLGLYICRELLRRMDGDISVSSSPGEGSVFTVSLPASDRATA